MKFVGAILLGIGLVLSSHAYAMCMFGMGGDCPPSDDLARASFDKEVSQMFNSTSVNCNIADFRKINGIPDNMSGLYNYQFAATLNCHGASYDIMYVTDFVQGTIRSALANVQGLDRTVSISYVLIFQKTENGWIYFRAHG
jgi:hypothetical protein